MYPHTRLRRLRYHSWVRDVVRENNLVVNDLIMPFFVKEGEHLKEPVELMPGTYRYSIDQLLIIVKHAYSVGIKMIALFPVVEKSLKDNEGSEAYNPDNLLCCAVRAIKSEVPDIAVITDVALDPYTSHGHDGILSDDEILNDESIEILCRQTLVQAAAGSDIIAPSDMMDGRIAAIRQALDNSNFHKVCLLSYAVKYSSCLYSPFRNAIAVQDRKLDKSSYQMDIANSQEALREIALDIEEGADFIIVKPGMLYLDIIKSAKDNFNIPVFAYQVSGEYAMLRNFQDERIIMESLIAFKRAGARVILTYFALEIAEQLCLG